MIRLEHRLLYSRKVRKDRVKVQQYALAFMVGENNNIFQYRALCKLNN